MNISRISLAIGGLLLAAGAWSGDAQKGLDAYNSGDYETALAEFQPLADAGDAAGQFGLGQMYGNGFGVMMDDALAIKWYTLAADHGHGQAQNNLAIMHQNGWGVPQSDEEAMRLFSGAAERGVAEAMMALGRFYAMDFSDDYDPLVAYKWFSIASKLDNVDANAKRDGIAEKLTGEQVSEGNAQVELWWDGHAEMMVVIQSASD
jgi:TPR repeat protein